MLKTVEAEIGPDGTVTLLESVKVKKKSRALVTVLGNGASLDNREAILALAGGWEEMSERDFQEYLAEAKGSGSEMFGRDAKL